MATLTQASQQWSSRPDDQRFTSLNEMFNRMKKVREHSKAKVISNRRIGIEPLGEDHKGLIAVVGDSEVYAPTNHSFGQLAQLAGAPGGYLRSLPSEIAADALNYGLRFNREIGDVGTLLHDSDAGVGTLRAATGPNYGRIWNSDIVKSLIDNVGDGVTGSWRVPGEFGKRVEVTKANTTLFSSDRDMYVFLADEEHRIVMPNRRDGKSGGLARGFFVWNSEVGDKTFGIATFLFDYVCCNRIVWGAEGFKEIKIRHTSSAPDKWLAEVKPALVAYANSTEDTVLDAVKAAQKAKVDEIDEFLNKRFGLNKNKVAAVKLVHESEEGRPMETLWDIATGITAYAKQVPHQDERVDMERLGGYALTLATA